MIVKLIGVAHKSGEYQGRQYDKLQLYFTKPCTSDESAGEEVVTPRSTYFPTSKVPSLTTDVKSFHDFFSMIGMSFDVSFDQYANLDSIRLIHE